MHYIIIKYNCFFLLINSHSILQTLTKLNLRLNRIDSNGALYLADALHDNKVRSILNSQYVFLL